MILQRVIEINYDRLVHGDQSQNIVIRPGDNIYVDGPPQGYVYIDGEISRPGVYNMPSTGRLTLSRLVAAAGGLLGIAIPERVDLTRKIGPNREATIRMNLAAIRQRTEPDIMMKPDDSVIIGTSFIAWPLAVIRNGFRATYGYGFVLDRNFGDDVFGPQNNNNFF
jgi:protein involved in polysaccharide export with SLBB domain